MIDLNWNSNVDCSWRSECFFQDWKWLGGVDIQVGEELFHKFIEAVVSLRKVGEDTLNSGSCKFLEILDLTLSKGGVAQCKARNG